jgi:hypothetical protein
LEEILWPDLEIPQKPCRDARADLARFGIPSSMAGEPAESYCFASSDQDGKEGDRRASERGCASERKCQGERVGPLVLTRLVKEDGRALILYARAQDERT